MDTDLIKRFCTPSTLPVTDYDNKVLSDAQKIVFQYGQTKLNGYSWGTGRTILLVHGWGSRASHLALLCKLISKSGFKVITYDAPAHFSSIGYVGKSTSNMFEYSYALSVVAKEIGPIYGLVGHSFGAFCGALIAAGRLVFADYKITPEKLILIGTPPTLSDILKSFCRHNNLDSNGFIELKVNLEKEFSFCVDDYEMLGTLSSVASKTLLIHDADDDEFAIEDIHSIQRELPRLELFRSNGSGHQKILLNRTVIAQIIKYLTEED